MRRCICILILLICFVSCSKGQSNDYSKEILGCWKMVDMNYEIKSNYPVIDSLILKKRRQLSESEIENPLITKFFNDSGQYYKELEVKGESAFNYRIIGDSIHIRGVFRQNQLTSKICIKGDTLFTEASVPNSFGATLRTMTNNDFDIPEDIKCEKMIRYAIFIRVKDCDKYQE